MHDAIRTADDAFYADGAVFEFSIVTRDESCGGFGSRDERVGDFAAENFLNVVGRDAFELDAEELGVGVAVAGDTVALGHGGSDAEGSGVGGRTLGGEGVWAFMRDVDFAGVVEVDEHGGDGGVVVHGDELVCAVVDVHDE